MKKLRKLTLLLLGYTVLVIIWGAWVRISHSGDGCGDTWPLCRGQLIPVAERPKTWIEFAHRVMSGLYGLLVMAQFFYFRRILPRTSGASRKWMRWVLLLMISEALLGAKLVLFGLVGSNDSAYRLFVMSLHQANSLLLTGSLAGLLASLDGRPNFPATWSHVFKDPLALIFLLIPISGAWAALSNTLFPSSHLWEGFQQDFQGGSHWLMKLRILHPLSGILLGSWVASRLYKRSALRASAVVATTILIGILTLLSLSPTILKLSHLFMVHLSWAFLIYGIAEAKETTTSVGHDGDGAYDRYQNPKLSPLELSSETK